MPTDLFVITPTDIDLPAMYSQLEEFDPTEVGPGRLLLRSTSLEYGWIEEQKDYLNHCTQQEKGILASLTEKRPFTAWALTSSNPEFLKRLAGAAIDSGVTNALDNDCGVVLPPSDFAAFIERFDDWPWRKADYV